MYLKKIIVALGLAICLPFYAQANEVSYHYDGKNYSGKDLPASIRIQLYELEKQVNEQRLQILDQYILEYWLREEAKANNQTPEDFATEILNVPRPSEADIKAFYDANWERINAPFEQVKSDLEGAVWSEQQQAKLEELVDRIRTDKNYRVNLVSPPAPVFEIKTAGFPSKGSQEAKVVLVEFSDFQCPHCKTASGVMEELLKSQGEQFRLVHRHMPVHPSGISRNIAEGSICADEQSKYWDYYKLAFEQQASLSNDSPLAFAKTLALDENKFKQCLENPDTAKAVEDSATEARHVGVTGTPSFFVNGKPVVIQADFRQDLASAIEAAVKAAHGDAKINSEKPDSEDKPVSESSDKKE